MSFPEVEQVLGKAGRAETSTDPGAVSMMETIILLKPKSGWRKTATWYDQWPRLASPVPVATSRRITFPPMNSSTR